MILIYYVLLYVYVYSHFIYKTAVSGYLDQTWFLLLIDSLYISIYFERQRSLVKVTGSKISTFVHGVGKHLYT